MIWLNSIVKPKINRYPEIEGKVGKVVKRDRFRLVRVKFPGRKDLIDFSEKELIVIKSPLKESTSAEKFNFDKMF